ncbi:MAG: peptidoglycan editing factor PgeF [Candidatus Omnitrophica bacterium]|nr:peptidoglycan editing factor PgeF [Candidatus Omnitrophota bacterium]
MNKDRIFPEHIVYFTSLRDLDFTFPKPEYIPNEKQIAYLTQRLGISKFPVLSLNQVHGADVFVAEDLLEQGTMLVDGDAIICQQSKIPIMVRTADCQPIFVYDAGTDAIGMVHAGWRSTNQNILINTLELMSKKYGTEFQDVSVVLGPSLRKCCYEVGEEFLEYFPKEVEISNGKRMFDLAQANVRQALDRGVGKDRIFDIGECTGCLADKYFSYRREKDAAGRMISVIMKKL